jgi:hypothetical protein
MSKTFKRSILGLVILVLAIGVAYAWNSFSNPSRWERGFAQIAEGDSEQKVLELMGKPSEAKNCDELRYSSNDQLWKECAAEYWYSGFMENWIFVISKNGKVVAKWHDVSP